MDNHSYRQYYRRSDRRGSRIYLAAEQSSEFAFGTVSETGLHSRYRQDNIQQSRYCQWQHQQYYQYRAENPVDRLHVPLSDVSVRELDYFGYG